MPGRVRGVIRTVPDVVGFDPGLVRTGIASRHGTTTVGGDAKTPLRLLAIHDTALMWLTSSYYLIRLAVIEDIPTHAKGSGMTATAWGVIALACERRDVPYARLAPATLKKFATGNGAANKDDMRAALEARLDGWSPATHDEVDAMWLRYAGLSWLGIEDGFADPPALEKGRWPVSRSGG